MIRAATFGDIGRIVEILHESHAKSVYAHTATLDEREARRLIQHGIQRNGHMTEGGSLVAVCQTDGKVEGFVFGILQRVYHVGVEFQASDLFWICTPRAERSDPWKLYLALIRWARRNPKVLEIVPGVTSAISDHRRTGKLLERHGFEPFGAIYRKEAKA